MRQYAKLGDMQCNAAIVQWQKFLEFKHISYFDKIICYFLFGCSQLWMGIIKLIFLMITILHKTVFLGISLSALRSCQTLARGIGQLDAPKKCPFQLVNLPFLWSLVWFGYGWRWLDMKSWGLVCTGKENCSWLGFTVCSEKSNQCGIRDTLKINTLLHNCFGGFAIRQDICVGKLIFKSFGNIKQNICKEKLFCAHLGRLTEIGTLAF